MLLDQRDLGSHGHDFTEIVVVLDGNGTHQFDNHVHPICAGDVFSIPRRHMHAYRDTHDLRISNLIFDEAFVETCSPWLVNVDGYRALVAPDSEGTRNRPTRFRLRPTEMAWVDQQIRRIIDECRSRDDGYHTVVFALFSELLVGLCRMNREKRPAEKEVHEEIGRVVSFLENNYAESVHIADLAELAGLPMRTLLRRFGRATGMSPSQYLLRVRIGRAASLLRRFDMSVTDIAGEVGFDDSNYFSRQFRNIMGTTPTDFRSGRGNGHTDYAS